MKKIKALSEKLSTGSMGEHIPLGADAENVDLANGKNVETAIAEINSKNNTQDSNISGLTNRMSTAESNISNLQEGFLGKPPTNHASSSLTYGGGTSSLYGHVKLTDAYTAATGTADSSIGASQKAVNSAYNALNTNIGTLSSLSTSTKTNLVAAINEVDSTANTAQSTATSAQGVANTANNTANANKTNIGTLSSLTTDAKTNLVGAINEVDAHANTAQSTADSAKSTATSAQSTATTANNTANTNKTNIGTLTSLTTDAKSNLVSAINEVDSHANSASSAASTAQSTATSAQSTATSAQSTATTANNTANTNKTNIGTLTSLTTDTKTNLVAAINEVDSHANTAQSTADSAKSTATTANNTANTANNTANTNKTNIGTLTGLTTDTKTSLVAAINEVDSHANSAQSTANTNKTNIGTLSSLKTSVKTNIVNAINNLYDNTIGKTLKSLNDVLLATQQGYYADALVIKELYNKFNVKIYQESQFNLQTFYTVNDFICIKQGNLVYINFSVTTKSGIILNPNNLYNFNSSGIPEELRPTKTCYLNTYACDGSWNNASQVTSFVTSDGIMQYSTPVTRAFYKTSGIWYVK